MRWFSENIFEELFLLSPVYLILNNTVDPYFHFRTLGYKVADVIETQEFLSDVWVEYLEGRCPIRRVIEEYKKHGFQGLWC